MIPYRNFFLILFFMALLSCSHYKPDSLIPFEDMGARQKAIFFMTVYSRSYDAYKSDCIREYFSEQEIKEMNEKLSLLIELDALIDVYQNYIQLNILPPKDLEENITSKTNRMLFLTIK